MFLLLIFVLEFEFIYFNFEFEFQANSICLPAIFIVKELVLAEKVTSHYKQENRLPDPVRYILV